MNKHHVDQKTDRKKWLVSTTCLALILTATTLPSQPVSAQEKAHEKAQGKEQANLSYNVYISSSRMFKIGLQTTLTADSYSSYMRLKPKGLAKWFANISMVMSASGRLGKSGVRPEKFSFYRKKKKRKRTSKIVWAASGEASTNRTYQMSPERQARLISALNRDVPDPLSAFLQMGIIDARAPCGKTQRIYDGGKVYDLKFKLLGKMVFGPKSNGAYKGPAFKCLLNHQPVAGYSSKALAKARKNPAIFTVWFAPVKSAVLNRNILLPIAATGKVKGRIFSAYTKSATFAGKPI